MKAASTLLTVLAILGGIAAGALFYLIKGQKETLISERDGLRVEKASLEAKRDELNGQVVDLQGRNSAMSSELGEVKTRNTTLEARANQLNRDLAQSRANAEAAQNDARKATEESALLRKKTIELTAELETAREGQSGEIKELRDQLAKIKENGLIPAANNGAPLPTINTSVASVGPRSAFVVLNAGSSQGLAAAMKLAIRRDGEVVAQAVVTELRENLAVAQVIPNTLTKAPRSGDSAYTVN